MKYILLVSLILTSSFNCLGQNGKTKNLLSEIQGQWKVDDNSNITYTKVIEEIDLTGDEIYNRVQNYFVYKYGSGKSVIQTQDKELGRIVGKGLYKDVHIGVSIITTYVDCWHILRVDTKDGRARIILTLTEYELKVTGGTTPPIYSTLKVEDQFPINPKGKQKTILGQAFYGAHKRAIATMASIEKTIKEGNTSKEIENDDW